MGGRKSYSSKKVTGRGLGRYKNKIKESIEKQQSLDIAINTSKAAVDNTKQKKEFKETIEILEKIKSKPADKQEIKKSDSFIKLLSEFDVEKTPLTKEEKKLLSYAKSRKRRRKK